MRQAPQSRRDFLKSGIGTVGLLARGRALAHQDRLLLRPDVPRSIVVQAQSRFAIQENVVHPKMFDELLAKTLQTLTGEATTSDAWRSLLGKQRLIGVKFNRSAQRVLDTTAAVADSLLRSMESAGYPRDQVICIEAPGEIEGTQPAVVGFDSSAVDFGSGRDELASVLARVTGLINVPFLKTHNLATMTCCLKNLSHGLIKHPARYHDNGCSPYIADINALPQIRKKVRVHLVDALRVVYRDGPTASSGNVSNEGMLLAGTDPVAVDTVGFSVLNRVRSDASLGLLAPTTAHVQYLADAHRKGLGVAVPHGLDVARFRLS